MYLRVNAENESRNLGNLILRCSLKLQISLTMNMITENTNNRNTFGLQPATGCRKVSRCEYESPLDTVPRTNGATTDTPRHSYHPKRNNETHQLHHASKILRPSPQFFTIYIHSKIIYCDQVAQSAQNLLESSRLNIHNAAIARST